MSSPAQRFQILPDRRRSGIGYGSLTGSLLFLRNFRARFPGLAEGYRDGLLAALDLLAAAGFQLSLFVFLHHFVNFGFAFCGTR